MVCVRETKQYMAEREPGDAARPAKLPYRLKMLFLCGANL
jgi:hypothetical protein